MRGNLAYAGNQYSMPGWIINDVVAFILGGVVPFLLYFLLSSNVQRTLQLRVGGNIAAVKRGLDIAVIAANFVLFALKFMYLALPLYASIIDAIIDPVVTLLSVGLYMLIAFRKEYVEKCKFKFVLMQVISAFIIVYGVLALLGLVLSVA